MSAVTQATIELADPGEAARRVSALNMRLARERAVPADLAGAVEEVVGSLSATDHARWRAISPELATHVLLAALAAQRAVAHPREPGARDDLRSALGRLSQSLALIAEDEPVSPERPAKEVARWLAQSIDVPQRELARLLGVPLRTFQRWISEREQTRPEGDDAYRVRALALVINQLRHALTANGVLRWLELPNDALRGRRPRTLLADPRSLPKLLDLARSVREGDAG